MKGFGNPQNSILFDIHNVLVSTEKFPEAERFWETFSPESFRKIELQQQIETLQAELENINNSEDVDYDVDYPESSGWINGVYDPSEDNS